ncbi:MAG TPA: TatD family hydrolase [Myxococcota bacterium]|nr:TatD family hydrolase [Myxococcota bacterium]HRY96561.1 TatD family hydrolase [Myxococcota bacterium]HSA22958.1 TatD family hydrolase [Myxococcota bacterium]
MPDALTPRPFIDPHVHADSRSCEDFERLAAAGCAGLVLVAGPGAGYRSPDSVLDHFRRLDTLDRGRVERAGLRAWVALGPHPAGLPERDLDGLLADLAEALRACHADAVGEVGLSRGSPEEERALARAFEVAGELGLPCVVHTAVQDKRRSLERILALLERAPLEPGRVLLDHLDASCLPLAFGSGCWLGLSVHPAKLSPAEAAALVVQHGPRRFVLDSDLGAQPSNLFALPAAMAALEEAGADDATIRAVVHDHALSFLGGTP